jgi:hypothetical protein
LTQLLALEQSGGRTGALLSKNIDRTLKSLHAFFSDHGRSLEWCTVQRQVPSTRVSSLHEIVPISGFWFSVSQQGKFKIHHQIKNITICGTKVHENKFTKKLTNKLFPVVYPLIFLPFTAENLPTDADRASTAPGHGGHAHHHRMRH